MFAGETILPGTGSPRAGCPRSDTSGAAFLTCVKAIDRNFNHHLANIRCVLASIFYVKLIHLVAEARYFRHSGTAKGRSARVTTINSFRARGNIVGLDTAIKRAASIPVNVRAGLFNSRYDACNIGKVFANAPRVANSLSATLRDSSRAV